MHRIQCPFFCLFGDKIVCPYLENFTLCHSVELSPGNGDAWCSKKIEEALTASKPQIAQGPLMRQNYSCYLCGLKSFVTYRSEDDVFGVVIKIEKDHKEREPTCPCPLDDLNIVGEPTEV